MATPRARSRRPKPAAPVSGSGWADLSPRWVLRVEGLAALVVSVLAYSLTGRGWWLFLAAFLIPDLGLLAYYLGRRAGAWGYNITHNTVLPLLWGLFLWKQGGLAQPDLWMPALWLAHVGWDRMLGFGLKYHPDFKVTHLQKV
ncbi:MAG TPA: DUF4260 domain-containing protein [bacterium]|jgi:hypothetical protein|nr:DUF4260 domain-containing protein [bacterium]